MPYIPNIWADADSTKPLSADRMNNLETGIQQALSGASTAGYDIILAIGQSNMSGRGTPFNTTYTDAPEANIFQFATKGANQNTIQPATEPLNMADTPSGIGPAFQFARWHAMRHLATGRNVLIIPAAYGGTALSTSASPLGWRRGVAGNLYAQALAETQAAIAAAGTGSRLIAAIWIQGETDGDNGTTGAQYQTDFYALINGLRSDLGLPTLPFIIGQMVPDYLSSGTRTAINLVHQGTPSAIFGTDFAQGPTGFTMNDGNHYNAIGQRIMGKRLYDAYERVTVGLMPGFDTSLATAVTAGTTAGVPSALQAFSTRQVNTSYTGPAMIVRRSSDSTTATIGFTSTGTLDTATLLAFAGSGSAYVTTLYDQSGYGRNVTQATAAAQPTIVNAGALITNANGTPAMQFDGSDDVLFNTTPVLYNSVNGITMAAVLSAALPSAVSRWWTESVFASGSQYSLAQPDYSTDLSIGRPVLTTQIVSTNTAFNGSTGFFNNAVRQVVAVDTLNTMSQSVDNNATLTPNGVTYARASSVAMDRFSIGGVTRSGSLAPMPMKLTEVVFWGRALGSGDRALAAGSQKSYAGTP